MWRPVVLSLGLVLPDPVRAHPHIFVETSVEVLFAPDGRPQAVRIGWVYDPVFSMLLVSDLELDPDFDTILTPQEHALLQGFDMNWLPGYHGDTHVTQDGQSRPLGPPQDWTSDYRDGQLRSTHLRALPPLEAGAEWTLAVYDPTYYTSYTLAAPPVLTGRSDCSARVFVPDWEAAGAQLQAALDEMLGAGGDLEADFPAVGALFSEEVRIQCPAPPL
jgi:polyphosphate kinase